MNDTEALYDRIRELEAIVFEMKFGLTVGDKLQVTPEFYALMVERQSKGDASASDWPVGLRVELTKIRADWSGCHVMQPGLSIGAIPIDMAQRMKLAALDAPGE